MTEDKIKVGMMAPSFSLEDQDQKVHSLEDHRGQWVVLYFYPKDNTSGCTLEAIDFTKAREDFSKLNAVILGVSPDSVQSHCHFIDQKDLKITLLSDTGKETLKDYGVWQKKIDDGKEYWGVARSTVLIDPEGKIAWIWKNVNVNGHSEEVKNKLKELQS